MKKVIYFLCCIFCICTFVYMVYETWLGIEAENYTFRDGCNFFVQANFNPEYKEKAVELVKQEIEKLKICKPSDFVV